MAKKIRKYAVGGKVTARDIARSKMKPDDNVGAKSFTSETSPRVSNPAYGANAIAGYKKGSGKVSIKSKAKAKKMNKGTGYYTGAGKGNVQHKINTRELGVDRFNSGLAEVGKMGTSLMGLATSMGGMPKMPAMGGAEGAAGLEDIDAEGVAEGLSGAVVGAIAKKGLNMKKRNRVYKTKKKK
jgi:hypothetical protein